MIHSLQNFIADNMAACVAAVSLITGLGLSALLYGRRHEQRTRERGSAPP